MFALPFIRRDAPELRGERINLRMPEPGDYREWSLLRQESRAFLEPWEPRWANDELSRASWRARMGRYREDYAQGSAVAFFIFDGKSGRLLGGITLGNIRYGVSQTGHIGYWMGSRHAGKGHMTEAVGLVTQFSFERLRLHRIEAACIPDNARSIRVLEKAGFRREGLLRSYLKINGAWQDHYLYALIAGETQCVTEKV
ncbi:GNAT family N-acetyltransferase [Oryzicola mucosus]|uniref:GNAT family N-acetyltransferase n=1 Tax=Oryzicola mucosus TaxID=2767425 RepID=A0A8J6PPJ5_9HYPH|nr:GNAT family N-acetyltransferase [Oryzicola mucosus]